jgi:predicted amidophosphoribosyltransferase
MELQWIVDLLFPPQCGACGAAGSALCDRCVPKLPIQTRVGTIRITALGRYEGALRRAVLALKSGRRDVARAFALRIAPLLEPGEILVPVPTTNARRRERGFDGCELIARLAAAKACARAHCGLLQIAGDRQRGRTRDARLAARGRFAWRGEEFSGDRVTLLDDVVTTGATLEDCKTGLTATGATVHRAIVCAIA